MKSFFKKCFHIYNKIANEAFENHVFAYASQATFFVIISIIPFIMLILFVLQMLIPINTEYISSLVNEFLPPQIQNLVMTEINSAYSKVSVSTVSITTVFLIWAASRGVKAISYGLRMVFGTNDNVGYLVMTFWSLVYTLLFAVGIIALIVLIIFGKNLADLIIGFAPYFENVINLILQLRYIVLLFILTLFFMSAYKLLGKSKIRFFKQFIGAFCAAGAWLLFSYVYSLFIVNIDRFSYLYGSLAAIIFMMLWLWFCMLIFLFGAEMNTHIYSNHNSVVGFLKAYFTKNK